MLSFNKPIFCSSKQPMPEFGEEAVIYFDPYSESELFKKIIKYDKNDILLQKKALESFILSKKYSYNSTIRKNLEYILDINK